MVTELTVENIAIIERAQIAPGTGFTVLTGETGAGKSLLVDAIQLALGGRADSDLVRTGAPRATVALTLDLSQRPDLLAACESAGFPAEDGTLFIQRDVSAEGRSTCRINGRTAPVGTLKALGAALVDLHGQHDHQSLFDPATHVRYLDQWIGEPAAKLLAEVETRFQEFSEAKARRDASQRGQREREQRIDLLRFQVGEIDEAAITPGEFASLEAQILRLRNVERIREALQEALDLVQEGETNASDLAHAAAQRVAGAVRHDAALDEVHAPLSEAAILLRESGSSLRRALEDLDADPAILEAAQERQDLLKRLARKYGEDEAAILAFRDEAASELETLESLDQDPAALEAAFAKAQEALGKACDALSALRQEHGGKFAAAVQTQLRDLAMERADLRVQIQALPPSAIGADWVEFLFSANPGETPRPLAKIASGGEISRVMLALKTALAGQAGVPTLIFDEVDAGLSGKAAARVAAKLRELAQFNQILVISHLPQIAAAAGGHWRIEKVERSGRVLTQVVPLNEGERVEEVARLLAGDQVTDAARANARELLAGG